MLIESTKPRAGIYVAEDQFAVWIEVGFFEYVLGDAHAIILIVMPMFAVQALAKIRHTSNSCVHDKAMPSSKQGPVAVLMSIGTTACHL